MKLTVCGPALDVPCTMNHRVILTIARRRTERVPLFHVVEPMGGSHVAGCLHVAHLHTTDETSP